MKGENGYVIMDIKIVISGDEDVSFFFFKFEDSGIGFSVSSLEFFEYLRVFRVFFEKDDVWKKDGSM